ncbi:MAG: ATPase [Anaerolineaceae bacterium]|nr:ATPase [Anaerolineaceae bacterium]
MPHFFLGADLGGTKTHVSIADESGRVVGFGEGGPGNHEAVGYDAVQHNLQAAVSAALHSAGLSADRIDGAGFGVAGYDWPIEKTPTLAVISALNLGGAVELVNDTDLGLLAGSPRLWGVAVVSGTGCNCRGWNEKRTRFGRVTGGGVEFGEFAGSSELVFRTGQILGQVYAGRRPPTALVEAFCRRYQVKDLAELLQGLICRQFSLSAADAPLIFEVARQGDRQALELVHWAGQELGAMVCSVVRQLEFESVDFDLVQIGSMWEGSPLLTEELGTAVHAIAPGARIIRTHEPPVVGAVLLGMQAAGVAPSLEVRERLIATIPNPKRPKAE